MRGFVHVFYSFAFWNEWWPLWLRRFGLSLRYLMVLYLDLLRYSLVIEGLQLLSSPWKRVLGWFYRVIGLALVRKALKHLSVLVLGSLCHCVAFLLRVDVLLLPLVILNQVPRPQSLMMLRNNLGSSFAVSPLEVVEPKEIERIYLVGLSSYRGIKLVLVSRNQLLNILLVHIIHTWVYRRGFNWH